MMAYLNSALKRAAGLTRRASGEPVPWRLKCEQGGCPCLGALAAWRDPAWDPIHIGAGTPDYANKDTGL